MKVVVVGCGRVGAAISRALSDAHDVLIIDWSASAFDRLGPSFSGETVLGNGIDAEVLRSARVEEADVFLALTDGDNRNLMASEIAAQLGAEHVLARVYDPVRAQIFEDLGLMTFSPTIKGADRLFAMVEGHEGGA